MEDLIVFAARHRLGCCEGGAAVFANCHYLEKYKKNRETLRKKNAWKTEGMGAAFRGIHTQQGHDLEEIDGRAAVNGISFARDGKILYSMTVENYSGIFLKDPRNDAETEGHIIHDNKVQFLNLDYQPQTDEFVASIQDAPWERHLALFAGKSPLFRKVTEGDCFDENPVWSKTGSRSIYYDSAGVGKDGSGRFIGVSEKVINRLDLDTGTIRECAAVPGCDCMQPKVDSRDELYFIKRPHNKAGARTMTFKEFLLMPYRFLRAIYYWIEFFTIRYTGEALTSAGADPAQAKQKELKELFINGNIINAEQALKENKAGGEKYPGIAPRTWVLMKREKDGTLRSVKKGVLDFDLTRNNEIVYSNGKYLIKIDPAGSELVIDAIDLVGKVRAN